MACLILVNTSNSTLAARAAISLFPVLLATWSSKWAASCLSRRSWRRRVSAPTWSSDMDRVIVSAASSSVKILIVSCTADNSVCRSDTRVEYSLSVLWHRSLRSLRNLTSAARDARVSARSSLAASSFSLVMASSCFLVAMAFLLASFSAVLVLFRFPYSATSWLSPARPSSRSFSISSNMEFRMPVISFEWLLYDPALAGCWRKAVNVECC
mmetsp:Transcript_12041/g.28648  ORF Transcript_12041/g.28648 Transcript_12041/m.28648 type:complete len:212 (+) Transcript_12041:875-1510(+)